MEQVFIIQKYVMQLRNITNIANTIYSSVVFLNNLLTDETNNVITNLDIEPMLVVSLTILKKINTTNMTTHMFENIRSIEQLYNNLKWELTKLQTKLEYNRNLKFFKYFMSYNLKSNIHLIDKYKQEINEKFKLVAKELNLNIDTNALVIID